jgi:hypothetical protein
MGMTTIVSFIATMSLLEEKAMALKPSGALPRED